MDAAVAAFAKKGLHNATMQDIAQEAGYTAASLYTYFKSKQEILGAVINRLTEEYLQIFEEPLPSGLTFRQRFEIVLRRQLDLAGRQHSLYHSFLGGEEDTIPCGHDENARVFHTNFERRIHRLAQWLRDSAETDDLGGHNPEIVARLLFGMGFGLLHQWGKDVHKDELLGYAPILTEFFFHGISGKPKTGARKK